MARTDTLGHFLTDVADAIRNKKGSSGTIQASSFDTEIASIPSGGGGAVEKKDINFYDYDGTILHSYTKSEFNNLQAMPDNPTHEGLTSMGWNWTLQEGKDYLVDHNYIEIGQVYQLSDASIKLFVSLDKYSLNPYVTFAVNGTATIDWGDNTTSSVTGTSASTMINTPHTYSNAGDYVIKISSNKDIRLSAGSPSYGTKLFWGNFQTSDEDLRYVFSIKKVFLNSNIVMSNNYTFYSCKNLEEFIFPNNGATMGTYLFTSCINLKHLTLPRQAISMQTNFCNNCYGLKSVSIGYGATRMGQNGFTNCYSLERLTIPNSVNLLQTYLASNSGIKILELSNNITSYNSYTLSSIPLVEKIVINNTNAITIAENSMRNLTSLRKLIVKGDISTIDGRAFWFNYNCMIYDFSGCSFVPTLSHTLLGIINENAKIIVPDDLYDEWITANNWSDLASYIVKASDYNEE